VGDDATVDAVFRDLGVIRVDTIEDMLVTAGAAARLGRLDRAGVGVVPISGGACDIIADLAETSRAPLPEFAPGTAAQLGEVLPAYANVQNPLDVTGAAVIDPSLTATCIEAVGNDTSIGVVLAVNRLPWQEHENPFPGQAFIDAIGKGATLSRSPVVFVNQVMQPITTTTREVLRRGAVDHAICGLSQAVTAVGRIAWWSANQAAEPEAPTALTVPPRGARRGRWSEQQARELLETVGVPVVPAVLARTADDAADATRRFDAAVAVKVVSPEILHKSDVGGIRLDVIGPDAARSAFEAVTAAGRAVSGTSVEGTLISPMRYGGVELLLGVVNDPDWGPMLAVAVGGVFVEVLSDVSLAPVPVTAARARELLAELRGAELLEGVRGQQPADIDAVVDVIVRVSELAYALGESLESIEINPLRVAGPVVEALDAVVTWRESDEEESS
jgi:acyl-CoA synthetase (NDP forming)